MRAAPPIDAPLGDGRAERGLIILLYTLALAVAAHWAAAQAGAPAPWRPALLSSLPGAIAGAWVARRLLPVAPGRLRWTGTQWLADDGTAVQVDLQLDAGAWLLLRLTSPGRRTRWAVARAGQAGGAWHGLRLALQTHAGGAPS